MSSYELNKPPFIPDNTLFYIKKEKPAVEFPKILPIHNSVKHKRYLETHIPNDESNLNLVGVKLNKKYSREKRTHEETIEYLDARKEKIFLERQRNERNLFLESLLHSNAISSVSFERK